jgi:tubulin---tyrosine ligase
MPISHTIRPATRELSPTRDCAFAIVDYDDAYVQPLIEAALKSDFSPSCLTMLPQRLAPYAGSDGTPSISLAALALQPEAKILQIAAYEAIDFDYALSHPQTCLISSYVIRKALIRKHFLTATVENWVAKNPSSILADHVKRSEAFEVDYAEFLDDALIEAFDLRASLERNAAIDVHAPAQLSESDEVLTRQAGSEVAQDLGGEDASNKTGRPPRAPQQQKEWWILKPSMSDRGQGIRLFSTMAELQAIFDQWDAELSDDGEEEEEEEDHEATGHKAEDQAKSNNTIRGIKHVPADGKEYVKTSHLRHFIAQPYIHPPLLVPGDSRKFHIRTYVLAIGSLRVYVFKEMLALFAAEPYAAPEDSANANANLDAHLTNTCLQTEDEAKAISVHRYWNLPLSAAQKSSVFDQICQVTGEIFEAAARGMMVHFQPLPNAFEVFGVDFLVDARGMAWLLEINAFPDFRQTGDELRGIVAEFWKETLRLAVGPFVGLQANTVDANGISDPATSARASHDDNAKDRMVLVSEVNLGQRWRAS